MKKSKKSIIALSLAGTLLISTCSFALAQETPFIKSNLLAMDQKVSEGLNGEFRKGSKPPGMHFGQKAENNNLMQQLVENGVITQETLDAVNEHFEKVSAERKAEFENFKNLSAEEKQALKEKRQEQPKDKHDPWQSLVAAGVITQDDADKIKSYIESNFDKSIKKPMLNLSSLLVEQGVVSAETGDKIAAFMEEKANERKAEMEKIRAMNAEEKEAYMQEGAKIRHNQHNLVEEMVNAGVITQTEADAINKIWPSRPDKSNRDIQENIER